MNLHHPTSDQLDDLLDQALAAGDVPDQLQARILALTDPALNARLDEALAPDAMPAGLESRILARLEHELASAPAPVVARIGTQRPAWVGYAAAAAVALVTGLAFYSIAEYTGPTAPGPIAQNADPETPTDPADLSDQMQEALAFADDTDMDQQLSTLQSRILNVSDQPIWGNDDDFQHELWRELAPDGEDEILLF